MNLFKDFVEGVASGFVSAVAERSPGNSACDVVTACCRQLGWSIDEHLNANQIQLHFKDPLIGIRKVLVSVGDHGTLVGFQVSSAATIPAAKVQASILGYLLARNEDLLSAWRMSVDDSDDVNFRLNYVAIASGLDHGIFRMLCESMVKEAYEFDAKLNAAGLLR
jgi:hypothetical protein